MPELTISLPFPPKELSPNSRKSWQAVAPIKAQYRETAGWAAKEAMQKAPAAVVFPLPPVTAEVTFWVLTRHRRDEQNLAAMLKPAWDGFVDAGLLADDRHELLKVTAIHVSTRMPHDPRRLAVALAGPVEIWLRWRSDA